MSGGFIVDSHYYLRSGNRDRGASLQVKKIKFSSLQSMEGELCYK